MTSGAPKLALLALPALLAVAGCRSTDLKEGPEPVNIKKLVVVLFDKLRNDSSKWDRLVRDGASGDARILFVGLTNKSDAFLMEKENFIADYFNDELANHEDVEAVARRFLNASFREMRREGITVDRKDPTEFMVPRVRNAFKKVMEQQGQNIHWMAWATLTKATGSAGSTWSLLGEFIDVNDGTMVTGRSEASEH